MNDDILAPNLLLRRLRLLTPIAGGVFGILILLGLASWPNARAESDAILTVCLAGPPTCNFASAQAAVNAAALGDVIQIAAGHYSGVTTQGNLTQSLFVSQSLTIRGGYTVTNWTEPDPLLYPTVLDAAGQGRVVSAIAAGELWLENLTLLNGDATGLGGHNPAGGESPLDAGGGLYALTTTLHLQNCSVLSSTADYGGGVYGQSCAGELSGSEVLSNSGRAGGGLYLTECSPFSLTGALLRANATLTSTTLNDGGGGLYLYNTNATLQGSQIFSNTSARDGAGVYQAGGNLSLTGTLLQQNQSEGYGGGLFSSGGRVTVQHNQLVSNTAVGGGGAVCLRYITAPLDAILSENSFAGNAADQGAGIDAYLSDLVVQDNTFSLNRALGACGGAAYLSECAFELSRNEINDNWANVGGGALTLRDSTGRMADNLIRDNTARLKGGALATSGSVVWLERNQILSNAAEQGGGLHLREASALTLTNNLLADNQADTAGGGLYCEASHATLTHNTLARNTGETGISLTEFDEGSSWAVFTNTILLSHTVGISVGAGNEAWLEGTLWGADLWANDVDWQGVGTIHTGSVNLWELPAFAAPETQDYHLTAGSAALDAAVSTPLTDDLDGQARPHYSAPDIGADEFVPVEAVKLVDRPQAHRGEIISYTLNLTNTQSVTLSVALSDVLPAGVEVVGPPYASLGEVGVAAGVLTWTGDLGPESAANIGWSMQISPELETPTLLSNVALVDDSFAAFETNPALTQIVPWQLYLPVLRRE